MRYHYTDPQNQPLGPVEYSELVRLAGEGAINDETSVIEEGAQQWTTWAAIKPASAAPKPPRAPAAPLNLARFATVLGDGVDVVLSRLSRWLSPGLLRGTLKQAGIYGHFAVIVGAVFGLVYAIILASRQHSFGTFAITGLGLVIALAIAQFSAQRFMTAGAQLIAGTPNRLSSKSFLECVGLFAALGAVGMLLSSIVASISADSPLPLIPGVVIACMLLFYAAAALHPEELNVATSAQASAGEEAISLLSFFAKVSLMIAPLLFMLLAFVGAIITIWSVFDSSSIQATLRFVPIPNAFWLAAPSSSGLVVVIVACLVPVLSYFLFLLTYLGLDLIRAILSVPAKLDALNKS